MTEIILGVIIGILFIERYFNEKRHAQEKANLINAVIAKNAQDKAQLDSVKTQTAPATPTELIATDNLTDEQWEKIIDNES